MKNGNQLVKYAIGLAALGITVYVVSLAWKRGQKDKKKDQAPTPAAPKPAAPKPAAPKPAAPAATVAPKPAAAPVAAVKK
jgi:hypothetical protein